jgi:hypothetical protein
MLFLKPEAFSGGDMYSSRLDNLDCKYFAQDLTELTERFDDCYGKYGKATVILGDSHALNIYNAYHLVTSSNFLVGLAKGGCRPGQESQECPYRDFLEFLKSHHGSIGEIVFHQSGSYLIFDSRGNADSSLAFKEAVDGGGYTIDIRSIRKVSMYLEQLAGFAPTTWLGPFTEGRFEPTYWNLIFNPLELPHRNKRIFMELDNTIESTLLDERRKFRFISLNSFLSESQDSGRQKDCIIWRDQDHWTFCGEKAFSLKVKMAIDSSRS